MNRLDRSHRVEAEESSRTIEGAQATDHEPGYLSQEFCMRALYTSATGMMAQQMNLDVISNNLANVSTTGYKKSATHCQDLLYQNLQTPGATAAGGGQLPTGTQVGLGVSGGTTRSLFTQGTIQQTGNQYDVAINGQ